MRNSVIAFVLAAGACLAPASAYARGDADVFGDWAYRENGSVIRIYPCANAICAKILRVRDRARRDVHNPNAKLRGRPVIGIVIASKAKKSGKASWRGNLYNTLDGHIYRGTINLVDRDTITLVGCFIGTFFCEAKTLHRATTDAPAMAKAPSKSIWKTYNTRH